MRYWDSSALVPLCVEEASTPHMRQLRHIEDPLVAEHDGGSLDMTAA